MASGLPRHNRTLNKRRTEWPERLRWLRGGPGALRSRLARSSLAWNGGERSMYMSLNEVEVTLGRADEFETAVEQWSQIQAQNPGFVGATLLQSYANPGRYTLFSRWTA